MRKLPQIKCCRFLRRSCHGIWSWLSETLTCKRANFLKVHHSCTSWVPCSSSLCLKFQVGHRQPLPRLLCRLRSMPRAICLTSTFSWNLRLDTKLKQTRSTKTLLRPSNLPRHGFSWSKVYQCITPSSRLHLHLRGIWRQTSQIVRLIFAFVFIFILFCGGLSFHFGFLPITIVEVIKNENPQGFTYNRLLTRWAISGVRRPTSEPSEARCLVSPSLWTSCRLLSLAAQNTIVISKSQIGERYAPEDGKGDEKCEGEAFRFDLLCQVYQLSVSLAWSLACLTWLRNFLGQLCFEGLSRSIFQPMLASFSMMFLCWSSNQIIYF